MGHPWIKLLLAVWGALLGVMPVPATADVSAASPLPKSEVNQSSGVFTESVQIQVPSFRGLEPQLALVYSSGGGNGFVGVGWTLTADSFIERTSPGGGMPRFDGSDIFTFDGAELMPCTQFGGTHCAKHQTYQRMLFKPTFHNNSGEWDITDKNGTKRTYFPLYSAGGRTFRWVLKTVTDIDGNKVTYEYDYAGSADNNALLKSISYNNALITFHGEVRPDTSSFATGWGLSGNVKRLKAISVKVGGSFARAYALTYNTSPGTNRSRLETVREIGRPDNVDDAGNIAGGLSLPNPITLAYQDNNGIFGLAANGWAGNTVGLADGNIDWNGDFVKVYMGDFNGDGRMDVLRQEGYPLSEDGFNVVRVYLANGDGSFRLGPVNGYGNSVGFDPKDFDGDYVDIHIGDFNGDGKADILRQEKDAYATNDPWRAMEVYLSNGDGTFRLGPLGWAYGAEGLTSGDIDWNGNYASVQLGDFDGDGRTDVLRQEKDALGGDGWNTVRIYLSNGNGSFRLAPLGWAGNTAGLGDTAIDWNGDYAIIHLGDFNGDGKTDVLRQESDALIPDYSNVVRVYLGNGDGTFRLGPLQANNNAQGLGFGWQDFNGDYVNIHIGDFNGDGKADILRQEKYDFATNDPWRTVEVYLSQGDGSFRLGPVGWAQGAEGLTSGDIDWNGRYASIQIGDFNGDGKADVLRHEMDALGGDGSNTVRIYLANGNGSFRLATPGWAGNVAGLADANIDWNGDHVSIQLADFNGDGNLDVFRHEHGALGGDGWNTVRTYLQPATAPDLLSAVYNGIGGTTSVAYVPSTNWTTTYMPMGSISQTVSRITVGDGRGLADTTTYSYAEAKWSDTLKRPLGYRYNKAVESNGSYTEVFHSHEDANPGQAYSTSRYSSGGALLARTFMHFANSTTAPYTSLLIRDDLSEHNGNTAPGTYRNTVKEYSYSGNAYGDYTKLVDWGDLDLAGDEITTTRIHALNTAAYLVDLVSEEKNFAGANVTTGTPLQHLRNYYDGATSVSTQPTRGNLTWDPLESTCRHASLSIL